MSARWSSRRGRWRQMAAVLALLALVFPSLGALPWIAASFVPGAVIIGEHAHAAEDRDTPHEHDASAIPGSPLHPLDHDCFPCQVLAHLSRCALLARHRHRRRSPALPRATATDRGAASAASVANLPPVRAPPAGNA